MKILLFLLFSLVWADESPEEIRNRFREALKARVTSHLLSTPTFSSSEISRPTSVSSVHSASFPLGPFGIMTGLLSGMRMGLQSSEEFEDDESPRDTMRKKVGETVGSLKNEIKQTVSDAAEKMSTLRTDDEDDSPFEAVGGFTDVIGSLFGKLASTLEEHIKSDPFGRSSSYIAPDVLESSFTQLKGPHICIREINRILEPEERTHTHSNRVQYYSQAMKYTTTKVTEKEVRQTVRIQECCDGFSTNNIKLKGCNKEVDTQTATELFSKNNVSTTMVIPDQSTVIFTSGSDKVEVFPEVFNDYDLKNEAILTSTESKKFIVKINPPEYKSRHLSISLNCISLNEPNIPLTTGRAHRTEEEIRPAADTVLDLLQADGRFKKFLSILSEETVAAFTNKSASHTVLPFTDETFEKFPKSYQDQINNRVRCFAAGIARAHIFQPATCYKSLSQDIRNIIRAVDADLVALNGVVHVVNDIIVKEDLEPVDEKLKSISPIMAAKLAGKIDANQPITVFVPTSLLPVHKGENSHEVEGSGETIESDAISEEMVLNQVIPWFLPSLKALPPTLTTGNTTIFAGIYGTPTPTLSLFKHRKETESHAQIGCSRIVKERNSGKEHIGACGASIFFLDKPIPKIEHSVESLIRSRPELTRFNELFTSFLEGDDNNNNNLPRVSTVFAPVNDSFSVNTMKRLRGSGSRLATFVKRHLIPRPLCEHDFHSQSIRPETISNKNGEHLKYSNQKGELFVEDSKIMETIVVENGVVHIIDSDITIGDISATGEPSFYLNLN